MNINRNNFEAFFLDYYDGKLNSDQIKELFLFLNEYPDLKESFESYENISLISDNNIIFENKESLKKTEIVPAGFINSTNYETIFTADMENDLSAEESETLKLFLQSNPHLNETYHLFKLTRLKPDLSLTFENKSALKKQEIVTIDFINESNYEHYFTAAFENDLTKEENQKLELFLSKNPHLQKEYSLFSQTKIIPDTSIIYENKSALKKFIIAPASKNRNNIYRIAAVAASVLMIFGIYLLFNNYQHAEKTASLSMVRNHYSWSANNNSINNHSPHIIPDANTLKIYTANNTKNPILPVKRLLPSHNQQIPINDYLDNPLIFNSGIDSLININNSIMANNNTLPPNKTSEPLSVGKYMVNIFRKQVNQTFKDFNQPAQRLNGWDIAQAGISGFNKITNSNIQLKRDASKPENSYALIGKNFSITKNYSGN